MTLKISNDMESKNCYFGINSIVVEQIRFYAKYLKSSEHFANEQLEDIEQELLLQVWPLLKRYDKNRGKFFVFSNLVIKSRTANLMARQLGAKRSNLSFTAVSDEEHVIDEITTTIDVEDIISKLPKKWQNLCQQLKFFNLVEVAKMNNISRTTLYSIVRKLRTRFCHLRNKLKT